MDKNGVLMRLGDFCIYIIYDVSIKTIIMDY